MTGMNAAMIVPNTIISVMVASGKATTSLLLASSPLARTISLYSGGAPVITIVNGPGSNSSDISFSTLRDCSKLRSIWMSATIEFPDFDIRVGSSR